MPHPRSQRSNSRVRWLRSPVAELPGRWYGVQRVVEWHEIDVNDCLVPRTLLQQDWTPALMRSCWGGRTMRCSTCRASASRSGSTTATASRRWQQPPLQPASGEAGCSECPCRWPTAALDDPAPARTRWLRGRSRRSASIAEMLKQQRAPGSSPLFSSSIPRRPPHTPRPPPAGRATVPARWRRTAAHSRRCGAPDPGTPRHRACAFQSAVSCSTISLMPFSPIASASFRPRTGDSSNTSPI